MLHKFPLFSELPVRTVCDIQRSVENQPPPFVRSASGIEPSLDIVPLIGRYHVSNDTFRQGVAVPLGFHELPYQRICSANLNPYVSATLTGIVDIVAVDPKLVSPVSTFKCSATCSHAAT